MYKKNRKLFNVGTIVLISTLFVLISINVFAKEKTENVEIQNMSYDTFEKPSDKEIEEVLKLRTKDYEKLTLKDFREQAVRALADNNVYEAYQKVKVYISENPEQLELDSEELIFLKYTLPCTYGEDLYINVDNKRIPSFYNRIYMTYEEEGEKGSITETGCFIDYSVSYLVKDDTEVTVAQRDEIVMKVVNEMQNYIDTMFDKPISDIEDCYNKLYLKFDEIVKKNSNEEISLTKGYISM
ncbi:MAG: hypothetical protein HFI03_10090 [Lachnospiraceae bacterium]|jgi:hypothetical protein|nr:hypothetical protein [Lachnospiraceae bacterium]